MVFILQIKVNVQFCSIPIVMSKNLKVINSAKTP